MSLMLLAILVEMPFPTVTPAHQRHFVTLVLINILFQEQDALFATIPLPTAELAHQQQPAQPATEDSTLSAMPVSVQTVPPM